MERKKTKSKQKERTAPQKGSLQTISKKTEKTVRERAFDEQLKSMSKAEKKQSLSWEIKHKTKRIKTVKKELDQAQRLAQQKGPHSFEAEVRVPQKTEEYGQIKRALDNYQRRLNRLKLTKAK